jgi:hypothetical protein
MSCFKLVLLGLLGVLAVGAASAASSSSAESCNGGTHLVFCNNLHDLLVGETVLGLGGLALLASILGGLEAKFHCPDFHVKGTLGKLGAGTGLLLFLHCKLEKPAGCKLTAADEKEIDANYTAQRETLTLALFTGSGTGETFTSLHIENNGAEKCVFTGTFTVTGKQMVETSAGVTVDQTVTAKKAESFLKFGVEALSFNGVAKVHLAGTSNMANLGLAWGVLHGE